MILNIYKPKGWTSFDIVARIRKLSGEKKVGHAGTLDPLAEGVLIVLTGKDTKVQDTFRDLPKKYYFEAILGVETPSFDMEYTPHLVSQTSIANLELKLSSVIDKFTGEIEQQAPMFSAKKVNGKRLYDVARQNLRTNNTDTLSIAPIKRITIYEINLVGIETCEIETDAGLKLLQKIKVYVYCSSGTYIRSIAMDIARELGTTAVVNKLERTKLGNYCIEDSKRIDELVF